MHVYTDGACSPNPGKGGWAFVVLDSEQLPKHISSGFELRTTNNRMEMRAVIEALKFGFEQEKDFRIYSDSTYVIGLCKDQFNMSNPKKNKDLIEELNIWKNKILISGYTVEFIWIRGHDGNIGNEFADYYATREIK